MKASLLRSTLSPTTLLVVSACLAVPSVHAQRTTVTVQAGEAGKPISPLLFGIFFEDLNYAADGGLYAELVQNRSFEYQATEQRGWNNLTSWELVTRGSAKGNVLVADSFPLNANNPHYVVMGTEAPGDGVGLMNAGYDGIPVTAGESYDVSFFARKHYVGGRWDGKRDGALPILARLETSSGAVLAEAAFDIDDREWRRFSATLVPSQTDANARLVLLSKTRGGIGFDEISLFPKKTFHNRANGLRSDLAQTVADLHPKFVRFPGGCLAHGHGLNNMYRWKDTIGPVEQRRQQANLWGYHQTVGLGYFEYFQFCEDIGAAPLPVVPAGVCCQNAGNGLGQAGLPLDQMPAFIQDLFDLIEWANGPVTSPWGAKRAAAGHPEPFGLKFIGVGNEDEISPVFKERFQMIFEALKAKHPEITVVGTAGPFPKGDDFEKGWKVADELRVPIVDEHYYMAPDWFWENLQRYDSYDRAKSKVYAGEYAAHDDRRRNTLRSALAEAAHLTALERNGDVVALSSYAPLLSRRGHTQWTPDMIYFTGTEVYPSINYQVQKLFGTNSGDTYLATTLSEPKDLAASTVRDSKTGDVIVKIVSRAASPKPLHIELAGAKALPATATVTVLAGADANVANEDGKPAAVQPQTSSLNLSPAFDYEVPANSLTIIRITRK